MAVQIHMLGLRGRLQPHRVVGVYGLSTTKISNKPSANDDEADTRTRRSQTPDSLDQLSVMLGLRGRHRAFK